jgi:hypothetical protein
MNHPNVQVTSPSDVTDRVRQDLMLVPGVLIGILD